MQFSLAFDSHTVSTKRTKCTILIPLRMASGTHPHPTKDGKWYHPHPYTVGVNIFTMGDHPNDKWGFNIFRLRRAELLISVPRRGIPLFILRRTPHATGSFCRNVQLRSLRYVVPFGAGVARYCSLPLSLATWCKLTPRPDINPRPVQLRR